MVYITVPTADWHISISVELLCERQRRRERDTVSDQWDCSAYKPLNVMRVSVRICLQTHAHAVRRSLELSNTAVHKHARWRRGDIWLSIVPHFFWRICTSGTTIYPPAVITVALQVLLEERQVKNGDNSIIMSYSFNWFYLI